MFVFIVGMLKCNGGVGERFEGTGICRLGSTDPVTGAGTAGGVGAGVCAGSGCAAACAGGGWAAPAC